MTPQSHFMVIAPITPSRAAALEVLLAGMNARPGQCDPVNELLPFALFERLHFARFVIVDDRTLGDLTAYGLQQPTLPVYLVFMGDCDGAGHAFLTELAERAAPGLARIFACCDDFAATGNLAHWLIAHDQAVSARYVNWMGRTVRQVKQEQALQRALAQSLANGLPSVPKGDALALRRALCAFVEAEQRAGRLALTPQEPTPLGWRLRNLAHALGMPLLWLIALPLLIVLSPVIAYHLRRRETGDPEIDQPAAAAVLAAMKAFESHDVSSPVSLTAAVKPGLFRRLALSATLKGVGYACRHIYRRGGLMRVQTLHFAHWAFLDDKTRLLYVSSHDGSFDACVQDIIDKMAWGLNLVFSHAVGYPRTDWLVRGGAYDAARFKAYARRHALPTQVWYKAYPGLTALDLQRNARIRQGLEQGAMSEAQAREWLGLI